MTEITADRGVVFRIQKYSIHDGPGIRTLVFLKGCTLRCKWCCNPESWNPNPQIIFIKQRCTNCKKCLQACPAEAIKVDNEGNRTIKSNCSLCLKCTEACAAGALELIGKYMKVRDVVDVIEQDRPFYSMSDGGVTLSGGEPTLQFNFSKSLLKECKKRGIHTAVETSGYCSWKDLSELEEFTDIFLFDIKILDRKKHFLFTSAFNDIVLKNLKALAKSKKKIVIRYPLIPHHNDKIEDLEALANLILDLRSEYDAVDELDLLPYHKYGIYKYDLLNTKYKLKNLTLYKDSEIIRVKDFLSRYLNIKIQIGG